MAPTTLTGKQREKAEAKALAEREALDKYIRDHDVRGQIQSIISQILEAKPENPKQWLLDFLETELSNESEQLGESELHRLFAVTRRITSEIIPQETIGIVICETLKLLHCDTVSLFVLDRKTGMLRLHASNLKTPIMVNPGQGIAGAVFNSRETVNIPDCYKDRRFDRSFDKKSGYITKSLLAVPILEFDGGSLGVVQAINKMPKHLQLGVKYQENGEDVPAGMKAVAFGRNDEKIVAHLVQHIGIALRNAEVYREAISTSERATGLLNTIQSLSQDLGTQSLLLTITMHANKICSAERSTVFLVDEAKEQLWSVSTDTGAEIRIPKKAGIAGQCCTEGIVINIPEAYADSRFNQEIDRKTGFKTHSILAIPMFHDVLVSGGGFMEQAGNMDGGRQVIGVIQMINKLSFDGQAEAFDDDDIEVMDMFAKFVGPKLTTSSMLIHKHGASEGVNEGEMALCGKNASSHAMKRNSNRVAAEPSLQEMPEGNEDEEGNE